MPSLLRIEKDAIEARVLDIIEEFLDYVAGYKAEITRETSFTDLKADWFEVVEIVMELAEEFKIETYIPQEMPIKVGDVIDWVVESYSA